MSNQIASAVKCFLKRPAVKKTILAIDRFWNPTGQKPYQQPAQGMAVTGFILALCGVIFWGWVPLLSFVGLALLIAALAKGNRTAIAVIGMVLALFAMILAGNHAAWVAKYANDAEARNAMLTESLNGAIKGVEDFIARVVAKLASMAA